MCSILTDGWTNRKYRNDMDLYVYYKEGINFIKSIENSANARISEYLFNWVKNYIKGVERSMYCKWS